MTADFPKFVAEFDKKNKKRKMKRNKQNMISWRKKRGKKRKHRPMPIRLLSLARRFSSGPMSAGRSFGIKILPLFCFCARL
jgi:hypothetical protein